MSLVQDVTTLFCLKELKSSYFLFMVLMFNTLNIKDKMEISLTNENVYYAQNSASRVKSTSNEDEIASLLSVNSHSTTQSMDVESTFDTLNIKKPCMKHNTLLTAASRINSDTPRYHFLERGIQTITDELAIRDLKFKTVRTANR